MGARGNQSGTTERDRAGTAGAELEVRPVTGEEDWRAAVAIRRRVFVDGQDCPEEEEFDGLDPGCRQLLGRVSGEPVATARWRVVRWGGGSAAKLERFAVLAEHRGRGHGRRLVAAALADARRAGHRSFVLHAQAHLEGFYRELGFTPVGERFVEAGIPHLAMMRVER